MVARSAQLPESIKPDAILESVMEVRFDAPMILPEVLFGRLAEHSAWSAFQQRRMPVYEIPALMREADFNLRFAPIFELVDSELKRAVRIGPHVFSFHVMAPYPGWKKFESELNLAIDELFAKAPGLTVKRLGMRYINALRIDLHGIDSPADLDLDIKVSQDTQLTNVNLNFMMEVGPFTRCAVKIATKDFVQGIVAPEARVFVDVDVFTTDGFSASDPASVKLWAEMAHKHEKIEFFHLLRESTITKLKAG